MVMNNRIKASVIFLLLFLCILPVRAQAQNQSLPDRWDGAVKHVVLVWLKEPGNEQIRRQLIETSKSFEEIPGVVDVSAGTPLGSERPVVDDSFDVAVIITFQSIEAMQNYETHPIHTKAVEEVLRPVTDRMVVYDFEDR